MANATVIGGGPAGLMAAEVLAEAGHAVAVYEHMASVGRKFQLAGRGGLNITHSEPFDQLVERYGPHRHDLRDALVTFTPDDLRDWCARLEEPTFVGSSGRVFPESFRATPLLRAWLRRLDGLGVTFHVRHRWLGWANHEDGRVDPAVSSFSRHDGSTIKVKSDVTVIALGGASWPRVGSDGLWADQFTGQDIAVAPLAPANCGVKVDWSPFLADRFAGVPLKNVAIEVDANSVRGDVMITKAGLEGGPIYAHSSAIRAALPSGPPELRVDLSPDLSADRLNERLERRRRPKDSRSTWLRRGGFQPVAIALLREATDNQIPANPADLAVLAKAVPVPIVDTMPIERAISTAGGVAFDELTESMMLKRLPGTFVAGEMLDWEAPTGGYLLQASFSTAVVAARGAIDWITASDSGDG